MSRRHNGLPGADWHRLTDLEPPVADEVLDAMAAHGIAAYAETPEPQSDIYFGTRPPTRAVDGVFVPLDALDRAREVLHSVLPDIVEDFQRRDEAARADQRPSAASDDEIWAGIVAAYDAPPAQRESALAADAPGTDEPIDPATEQTPPTGKPAPGDGLGTSAALGEVTGFEDIRAELELAAQQRAAAQPEQPLDPDERWTPPPAPPLPTADPITRLAWTGFIGGPIFLLLSTLFDWDKGGMSGLVAVLATVGGFVTLVARMRKEPRDPGDDGAVV